MIRYRVCTVRALTDGQGEGRQDKEKEWEERDQGKKPGKRK